MSSDHVSLERHGAIAIVQLNRPPANAIEMELGQSFEAALDAALAPPSDGVSFWSWPPLAEQDSKREILARGVR